MLYSHQGINNGGMYKRQVEVDKDIKYENDNQEEENEKKDE